MTTKRQNSYYSAQREEIEPKVVAAFNQEVREGAGRVQAAINAGQPFGMEWWQVYYIIGKWKKRGEDVA